MQFFSWGKSKDIVIEHSRICELAKSAGIMQRYGRHGSITITNGIEYYDLLDILHMLLAEVRGEKL